MRDARVTRTRQMRVPFAAELRATELNSGREIWGETTNLNKGGCFVRTSQLFPQDTLLLIEIKKSGVQFVADPKVADAFVSEGRGLSFLNIPGNQVRILEE